MATPRGHPKATIAPAGSRQTCASVALEGTMLCRAKASSAPSTLASSVDSAKAASVAAASRSHRHCGGCSLSVSRATRAPVRTAWSATRGSVSATKASSTRSPGSHSSQRAAADAR
ncbi:uncharacterized protein IUM83_11151 [Phytophthora cinnamomi]|uniref:uncharacterized protein n=1 Tax=Phytophthora cinnamomi TaxID=4785 RepID=UPI00355A8E4D|nr:hypothetical protein IUM83_11151 [Phytophthora cinnamomi]